jgi:NTP pyrophosphatase (non-canonical NTP hydrolase)
MMDYLLTKLAEEAGELVVAALKHRTHRSAKTRRDLRKESGDVLALLGMLVREGEVDQAALHKSTQRRAARERKRCKNR